MNDRMIWNSQSSCYRSSAASSSFGQGWAFGLKLETSKARWWFRRFTQQSFLPETWKFLKPEHNMDSLNMFATSKKQMCCVFNGDKTTSLWQNIPRPRWCFSHGESQEVGEKRRRHCLGKIWAWRNIEGPAITRTRSLSTPLAPDRWTNKLVQISW